MVRDLRMPTILINPIVTPLLPMCWVGFLWSIFNYFANDDEFYKVILWFLSIAFASSVIERSMRLGTNWNVNRLGKILVEYYFDKHRFRHYEQSIDKNNFVEKYELYGRSSNFNDPRERNSASVIVFWYKAVDPRAIRVSQCFPGGPNRPTVILIKRPLQKIRRAQLFEMFHELGHASKHSEDVISLSKMEPFLVIASLLSFVSSSGASLLSVIVAIFYLFFRINYWLKHRIAIEPEIIADAYAVTRFSRAEYALKCAKPLIDHLDKVRRAPIDGVRGVQLFKEMVRRNVAHMRYGILILNIETMRKHGPKAVPIFSFTLSPTCAILNIIIIFSPCFGQNYPEATCITLLFLLILISLCLQWQRSFYAKTTRIFWDRLKEIRDGA